uniref:NADH:ubiquinone reductase (H(+)-translocating) n=1 Tax=Rhinebothriidae sp. DJM-2021 TaxID=2899516 RepID=A0A8K1SWJ8_9CEST|nr:NADH dehydrogenase subunit 5 [Rhinebothriidae sp. DJM-2021]
MLFNFLILAIICAASLCLMGSFTIYSSNLTLNGSCWEPLVQIDYINVSVWLMLIICFGYVYFYTSHYFGGDSVGFELNKLINLFVLVMATLVATGDFLTTLVFWEYLGVVSFFLILFYSNYLSLRSSVVTLVSSRFGDVCLFILIGLNVYSSISPLVSLMLIFFIIMTKSAGFPFISWLLEAMRAPTPVSSLVHSSTLVAAGVWFSMRYDMFLLFNNSLIFLVTLLSTILITGLCCFYFLDLKKIVALSTCNNISWCLFYLICGDVTLSLFQLITHGVSKCMLFMLVGDVMSGTGGSQASNCMYMPSLYGNWGVFSLSSLVLGLSGAPFIGVFFTKHFLLTNFNLCENWILTGVTFGCVFLSYFYSFRLCSIFVSLQNSSTAGVYFVSGAGMLVYVWLLVNYYIANTLDEVTSVGNFSSALLLLFQLISCLTAYFLFDSNTISNWSSSIFGCDNLVETFYSLYSCITRAVSLFFFRWDNYTLGLFNNNGESVLNAFNSVLLNAVMISLIIFLMCCYILL